MIDLIQKFISTEGNGIISELTGAGFSSEQANSFLPEALNGLVDVFKNGDWQSLIKADSVEQASNLLAAVDIESLSSRLGIEAGLAQSGVAALIPKLLAYLKNNQGLGSLLGALGNGAERGLGGLAKGLFN